MINRFFYQRKSDLLSLTVSSNKKVLAWLTVMIMFLFVAFLQSLLKNDKVKGLGIGLFLLTLGSTFFVPLPPKDTAQGGLNDNFSLFLKLTDSHGFTKKQQEVLKKGHCYGLSVVHGAMSAVGKLEWWEGALIEIMDWDGKLSSLDKKLNLPNADGPTTLEEVFERALNYILDYQESLSYLKGLSSVVSRNLSAKFEILDGKVIKKVQHISAAAGDFSKEKLALLLNGQEIQGSICLISNHNHSISINYDYKGNARWMVYNSNYSHASKYVIHRLFDSKKEAIDEINAILGSSITIVIADISVANKVRFLMPQVERLLRDNPLELIRNHGLLLILRLTPEYIQTLCDPNHIDAKKIRDEIVRQFSENVPNVGTILHIGSYSPEALQVLLNFIKVDISAPRVVTTALATKKDRGLFNGLQSLAQCAPDQIPTVINIIKDEKSAPKTVMQTLVEKSLQNWTGFAILVRYAPMHIELILDFIKNEKEAAKTILQGLKEKNNDGWSGLQLVIRYAPKFLPAILDFIKNEKDAPNEIAKLLDEENEDRRSARDMLITHAFQYYALLDNFIHPAPANPGLVLKP